MSVFGRYADWYDLFYADKDYRAEAQYVDHTLRAFGASGGTLLEIGCGTGTHAEWMATHGWRVCGVDRSEGMLARARQRLAAASSGDAEFHAGDARRFDLDRRFDAAVSLFHVMSYQAEPGDLEAAMDVARRHLSQGGLFLFDFWFGPAVLAQRPETRTRTVENEHFRVVRTATPALHEDLHVVNVRYDFDVSDKAGGGRDRLDELHRMRYLFAEEITRLAAATDFRVETILEWMSRLPPDERSWNACAVLRAGASAE